MKKYISSLHTKSPAHKKRFALLVSGSITLIIFGIWSFVKFSDLSNPNTVADTNLSQDSAEITPINSLTSGIANSLEAIKSTFSDLKNNVQSVNLQSQYDNMKKEALPTDSQNANINTTNNTNGQ